MMTKSVTLSIIFAFAIFAVVLVLDGCEPKIIVPKSRPEKVDSDCDGHPDRNDAFPNDPKEWVDTDGDGIGNNEDKDDDNDGLSDEREIRWACDPTDPDTDDDGFSDKCEIDLPIEDPEKGDGYPYSPDTIKGKDNDKDGIPVGAEIYETKTNPRIRSTDGDRYSDGMEILGYDLYEKQFLPAYVQRNPFSPATPDLMIEIQPVVKLILDREVKLGKGEFSATEHQYKLEKAHDVRITSESGIVMAYESKLGWPPWKIGGSAQIKAYQDLRFEASGSLTKKWSDREVTKEEISCVETVRLSNSKLQVGLQINNIGNDALTSTLEELILNFYVGRDESPFHTERPDIKITNLMPKEARFFTVTVPITFDVFKRFQAGEGIDVRVEHYSFGNDQEYLMNVRTRCIQIELSDGEYVQRHYVSPDAKSNFVEACELAGITLELSDDRSSIVAINGKRNHTDKPPYCWWTCYLPEKKGETSGSIDSIQLHPGDYVLLKYNIDSDGDMLSDNEELIIGTNIKKIDTDEDGLTDGASCKELGLRGELSFSTDPLLKDTDSDGWSDGNEVDRGTSPTNAEDYPIKSSPIVSVSDSEKREFKAALLFWLDYESGDVLSLSDIDRDGKCEIVHGGRDDWVRIYSISGEKVSDFKIDFQKGDCLAVGDVDGDGNDEIVHADRWDWVRIFNKTGEKLYEFELEFAKGDCLAVGDVDGDGNDEIVHADRWDWRFEGIRIYNKDGTRLRQLRLVFDKGDHLAIGDMNGDGIEDIVHGERDGGIEVYMTAEEPESFRLDCERFDGMAVGDIDGDGKCEIVHSDGDGWVRIYSISGEKVSDFKLDFQKGDGLAVGDVNGDGIEDIVHVGQDGRTTLLLHSEDEVRP